MAGKKKGNTESQLSNIRKIGINLLKKRLKELDQIRPVSPEMVSALTLKLQQAYSGLSNEQLKQLLEEAEIKNLQLQVLLNYVGENIFSEYTGKIESIQHGDLSHYSDEIKGERSKRKRPNAGRKKIDSREADLVAMFVATNPKSTSYDQYQRWYKTKQGVVCPIKKTKYYQLKISLSQKTFR